MLSQDPERLFLEPGVEATNDEATICKYQCTRLKYWDDPFLEPFVQHHKHAEFRSPEIYRGYWARYTAISELIRRFIGQVQSSSGPGGFQIVNIGSGFDTLYWRLHKDQEESSQTAKCVKMVDIDLPSVVNRKIHTIKMNKKLQEGLSGNVTYSRSDLHSDAYHLFTMDLSSAKAENYSEKLLTGCALSKELPTLFLAECVLVYLQPNVSDRLLKWISSTWTGLAPAVFINYEQANLADRFGEVMQENLRARDCDLQGAAACESLTAAEQRFLTAGWTAAKCVNMSEIYNYCLPFAERERIEKIHFLDEKELLDQLLVHYGITVAHCGGGSLGPDTKAIQFQSV